MKFWLTATPISQRSISVPVSRRVESTPIVPYRTTKSAGENAGNAGQSRHPRGILGASNFESRPSRPTTGGFYSLWLGARLNSFRWGDWSGPTSGVPSLSSSANLNFWASVVREERCVSRKQSDIPPSLPGQRTWRGSRERDSATLLQLLIDRSSINL